MEKSAKPREEKSVTYVSCSQLYLVRLNKIFELFPRNGNFSWKNFAFGASKRFNSLLFHADDDVFTNGKTYQMING